MKKDYTSIVLLLDRSGSMQTIRNDVIGGVNSFVEKQAHLPGTADLTLIQFDDKYEVNFINKPLKNVLKLNEDAFVPRGMTALLDAIGRGINDLGHKLAKQPENKRPERVIFVIFSDGQENTSFEFTYEKISEMIKHQRDKYNWQFIYLGANLDAVKEASRFGILKNNAMTYSASTIGTQSAYSAVSDLVGSMRCSSVSSMNSVSFSEEDKKEQEKLINNNKQQ